MFLFHTLRSFKAALSVVLITCVPQLAVGDQPPPIDRMGRQWQESESGWQGVWIRRGNSNIFDARWGSEPRSITAEMAINISGNRVTIKRSKSSDGNDCDYSGTIANDGVKVEGTYTCTLHPGPFNWSASIQQ